MTNKNITDRVIALAGVIQSCTMVDTLATTGRCKEEDCNSLLYSIFQTNPETSIAVYGNYSGIKLGLTLIAGGLTKTSTPNILRYFAHILSLQRKLLRRDDLMQRLDNGIQNTKERLTHFPMEHENIQGSLADLYSQTVSKLNPRIMIRGDADFLAREQTINRVRTLLLAGIRSGILWTQCGGSRLELLFSQKKITESAQFLIQREQLA